MQWNGVIVRCARAQIHTVHSPGLYVSLEQLIVQTSSAGAKQLLQKHDHPYMTTFAITLPISSTVPVSWSPAVPEV